MYWRELGSDYYLICKICIRLFREVKIPYLAVLYWGGGLYLQSFLQRKLWEVIFAKYVGPRLFATFVLSGICGHI